MRFSLEFIEPKFSGNIFGTCSAITTTIGLILTRMIAGSVLGIGERISGVEQAAANAGMNYALSGMMAILVPTAFCVGWATGFGFALIYNLIAPSRPWVKIYSGSFKLKED